MSTHCSGCGSAEIALDFIKVGMLSIGLVMAIKATSSCVRTLVMHCCAFLRSGDKFLLLNID